MTLFVAQIPDSVNGMVLESLFAKYGEVEMARVVYDKHTGRSKHYGFVDMPNDEEAKAAIEGLDGKEIDGKEIVVKEAEPPKKKFQIRM